MEVWKTEDPRVNFEKRFAHYEIYTWTLCHSYIHEKQTSRIQSLIEFANDFQRAFTTEVAFKQETIPFLYTWPHPIWDLHMLYLLRPIPFLSLSWFPWLQTSHFTSRFWLKSWHAFWTTKNFRSGKKRWIGSDVYLFQICIILSRNPFPLIPNRRTRQIIRYRATANLRRPHNKQSTASNVGRSSYPLVPYLSNH